MPLNISNLDLLVFVILTIVTLFYTVILCKRRKEKNTVDYLLFGRRLTLPLFVATLVSTWYGDVFGVTQIAFERGISTIVVYGIGFYVAAIFFMIFVVEKARKIYTFTLPEIIEKYYGKTSAKIASLMIMIKALPVTYLIGIGLLIQKLFSLNLYFAMLVGLIFVVTYMGIRGFQSIVYSDIIQFVLMYFSVIMVVVFSFTTYGDYSFLMSHLDNQYFVIDGYETLSELFMWFFISIITTFMSPIFYQRCFAAKSVKVAKSGIIISVIFWMICDFCTVIGSMYAKVILPNSLTHEAYFNYALEILPVGFKGIFLSGIAATILSTLDSFLFVCSSTLIYDLMGNKLINNNFHKTFGLITVSIITFFVAGYFIDSIDKFYILIKSYCGVTLAVPLILTILFGKILKEMQFIMSISLSCMCMIVNDFILSEPLAKSFYIGASICFLNVCVFTIFNYLCRIGFSERYAS